MDQKTTLETIDWELLFDPKNEDERADLYLDDLEALSKSFVASLQTAINEELNVIVVEAKKRADVHWASNRIARIEEDESNQWRFGTRVKLKDNSIIAEWYKNRFKPDPNGGKSEVFSTYVKKGKGFSYNRSSFKSATPDELKSIEMTEQHYTKLRMRSQKLSKLRKLLREYEQLLGEK